MSGLLITPSLPPVTGRDAGGVNRRLALFFDAIGRKADVVRVLRIVPAGVIEQWEGRQTELNDAESRYWGCHVEIVLCPRRSRQETLYQHYIAGIVTAAAQPGFFPFASDAAVQALRTHLTAGSSMVFVHRLSAMNAVLQTGITPANMFFDLDDLEHRVRLRHAFHRPLWPGKLAYSLHVPALIQAERKGARLSRATFVCSDPDRDHLMRLGVPRVLAVPNAVTAPGAPTGLCAEPTVLFLGVMSYRPNRDAAIRLWRDIMPLVWRQAPDANLLIVGEGSESLDIGCNDSRVERLGYVDALHPLYARARIICSPITTGGGTRIKLVEAAAYGKPMVSTRIGAEGLAFADGEEIMLRDRDEAIAGACVALLADDEACLRLGRNARSKMLARYERTHVADMIGRIINGTSTADAPAVVTA